MNQSPMPKYQGTKTLFAKPMTRGEYNAYRGWVMPPNEDPSDPGYLVEYTDGGKANDSRHAGYISWSPKDVFERTYRQIDGETMVQPKIAGYQQLSQDQVDLVNEGKALAQLVGAYVSKLRRRLASPPDGPIETDAPSHDDPLGQRKKITIDQRWISIGATQLQQGFMAVFRGINQPSTF